MRSSHSATILILAAALVGCATGGSRQSNEITPDPDNTAQIASLRKELRAARAEREALDRAGSPGAQSFFGDKQSPLDTLRSMPKQERQEKAQAILSRIVELSSEISERFEAELQSAIAKEFGPMQPAANEEIELEALDADGNVVEVPVLVETRPLRHIGDADNAARLPVVFGPGRPLVVGYDGLPVRIVPEETEYYRRIYNGEAADAIAMEAKSLVLLKGGEWSDPADDQRVANGIAVRGLDMNLGLRDNGNKTYDDTIYIVLEGGGRETKVIEYRATTESSSTRRGVGRLAAKQVTYQRGLHRRRDLAYRLKGDRAEGTRRGRKGTYEILGANMHSAYSSKQFDSATPLSPNVSLGCQVVATSKRSFEANMVKFLDNEGVRSFPYTIIEDDEMRIFERLLRESGAQSVLVHTIERTT